MKLLRALVAGFLLFPGIIVPFIGIAEIIGTGTAERTIEHNRQLERVFAQAANYVVGYREKYGQLPSKVVFESWANAQPPTPYSSPNGMSIELNPFSQEEIKEFGTPPPNSFLLVYWRGEWFEYFASWANKTSPELDASKFYVLGSKYADGVALISIGIFLIFLAAKI